MKLVYVFSKLFIVLYFLNPIFITSGKDKLTDKVIKKDDICRLKIYIVSFKFADEFKITGSLNQVL